MSKKLELSTGRKVEIKDMPIDDVDYCSDIAEIVYNDDGDISTVRGVSKSRTAWIRRGLTGGDFKNFALGVKGFVSDETIKELSEIEKNELMGLIQSHQNMGE